MLVDFHNLILENKHVSTHLWAISFFIFLPPPAPTSLLFAFMRFLTILRLVIQIVVSDRETLFAVFLARDVGDFAE